MALLLSAPVFSGCIEAGLQSGVFACNTDSQCPPGGFFCDNYFNTYMYYIDVTAEPVVHDYWGFCNSEKEVIKKGNIPAEICANGRDEDEDGLVDCDDLECQTSPTCRLKIQRECGEGGSGTLDCDAMLGFPRIRKPLGTEVVDAENTCPLAVGYFGDRIGGSVTDVCLPRCRLYFPYKSVGMSLSDDDDFLGSDDYCNTIMNPLLITEDRFVAPTYRCVHLNMSENDADLDIQNDVCVPATDDHTTVSDCSVCTTQGKECLLISTRNRANLAIEVVNRTLVPIDNTEPDGQDLVYCF
jgi:hypothetical protein